MKIRFSFAALVFVIVIVSTQAFAMKFETKKIKLGNASLTVEVADDPDKREQGLMNRPSLNEDQGMIFIFPAAEPLSFWMKNTTIPLSIGYFDNSGKLFQIMDMDPASPMELSPKVYISAKPARYALEVAKGWYGRKKIQLGTKLDVKVFKPAN